MKKYIALFAFLIMIPLGAASAQGMMAEQSATGADDHTAKEEAEGKEVWGKLQAGTTVCTSLSDEQLGALGEYFMGQMTGNAHVSMNQRITQMMGEEGEEAMHVVLGKRLSGCDTSAAFPTGSENFMMPMMGGWSTAWMDQDGSSPFGKNSKNNMMNFGFGHWGWFGGVFMILWWVLIIAGIVLLVRHFGHGKEGSCFKKSVLDTLKERYAKGEIDKSEYESKKKDLG
ncbi:MAG: SHOCT domain-containing protein [bacterium]|nr:SHOCT domain-containing protein [bacterium]